MRAALVFVALAAGVVVPSAGMADDNGVAGIHAWRQVAGRTCFVDHTHQGGGTGATQALAMREAIRSWQSFTDLEYGSDWASYANSISKEASCSRTMAGIECRIESIPCKGGALTHQLKRPAGRVHKIVRR